MLRYCTIVLSLAILLSSCMSSPYYQKNISVPQNAWDYNFKPDFKVKITDTTSFYNIYFLIRHTEAYTFSNVWIKLFIKSPGDSVFRQTRIEIPLAAPTGQWLARGSRAMGEIWEHRMLITTEGDKSILGKAGEYEIRMEQDMRVNPLTEVLQVGLRIEKGGIKPQDVPVTDTAGARQPGA